MGTFLVIVFVIAILVLIVRIARRSSSPETSGTPRRGPGPVLPDSYFPDLLQRAGWPLTPHNLFAVQEQVGIMFTTKAWQAIESMGTESDWNRFLRSASYPTVDMQSWPQRVLDGMVAWNPRIAPHIDDLPERYAGILLEDVQNGSGTLFGGSPSEPLPTATEWKMKGLKQPRARPMLAPH